MNFAFTDTHLRIGRDATDKRVPKESTVVFRILEALNSGETKRIWVRFFPYRHGLTCSKIGIRNTKTGEVYWHGNYAIEAAHKAFNDGELILNKD